MNVAEEDWLWSIEPDCGETINGLVPDDNVIRRAFVGEPESSVSQSRLEIICITLANGQ